MAPSDTEPGTGNRVRLGGDCEIYSDVPLAELCSPGTRAYAARRRDRPDTPCFALLCEPGTEPRRDLLERFAASAIDGLVAPSAWGVVDWPSPAARGFAILFEQPVGPRLWPSTGSGPAIAEEAVLHRLLPPLIATLRALTDAGLTHRAIRPGNLFRSADGRGAVLGECVSAPAALHQPFVFETVEGGLAMPLGRGPGTPASDLYALGVTLVALLLGSDPADGRSDETLLADKIEQGSFAALRGALRLQPAAGELLRGLLADEPRERWSLRDLELWARNRPLPLRGPLTPTRVERAFDFADERFRTPRSLAMAFVKQPAAAARRLRSSDLPGWMEGILGDSERAAALRLVLREATEALGAAGEARLLARVAIILDPAAPLRYSGLATAIDGVGPALAAAFAENAIAPVAAMLAARLPQFWLTQQAGPQADYLPLRRLFDRVFTLLEDRRPGFGIERVLYELNPGLPCLSALIGRDYIVDPGEILAALERAAAAGKTGEMPVDRHVAAFLGARWRGAGTDWQGPLAAAEPAQRTIGLLLLLGRLQAGGGPAAVPALGQRLARQLPPLLERFQSRSRRGRLMTEAGRLAVRGQVADLARLLFAPGEVQRDQSGYRQAQHDYGAMQQALRTLNPTPAGQAQLATELGGRAAVWLSAFLAILAAAAAVWKG